MNKGEETGAFGLSKVTEEDMRREKRLWASIALPATIFFAVLTLMAWMSSFEINASRYADLAQGVKDGKCPKAQRAFDTKIRLKQEITKLEADEIGRMLDACREENTMKDIAKEVESR